ncbi:MAG: hypothetical protein IVW57_17805, partial [Ktedonobacterales bacterium]|nr:hypothetical protein [Ktedonobacterales bacterium]
MGQRAREREANAPTWPLAAAPRRTSAPPAKRAAAGSPAKLPDGRRRWAGRVARAVLVALLALTALLAFTGWRLNATVTSYSGAHFNQGRNATWLEHTWAGDPHTTAEYDQLASQLTRERMGYVFVHVGPLSSDGTIAPDLARNAAAFTAAMHQRLPSLRILAW